MNNICVIPVLDSTVNQLDYRAAALLAKPYDDVILMYPKLHDYPCKTITTNIDTVRRTNSILQLLAKPVWIQINALWPAFATNPPAQAYQLALASTILEVELFWSMLPVQARQWVKGFVFDHSDYYRMFGDINLATKRGQAFFDRDYTNALIEVSRSYALPTMIITANAADIVGNIYNYQNSNDPGAVKWASILGNDSSLLDWLMVRDVFYRPIDSISGDSGYVAGPGPYSNPFGTNSVFCSFFESWPILKKYQTGNLAVGIIQHMDFSANISDSAVNPLLTPSQQIFLAGLATFLQLIDIQGFAISPLSSSAAFIPNYTSVTAAEALPPRNGGVNVYSLNGSIIVDYISGVIPTRLVTTQSFDQVMIYQQNG